MDAGAVIVFVLRVLTVIGGIVVVAVLGGAALALAHPWIERRAAQKEARSRGAHR